MRAPGRLLVGVLCLGAGGWVAAVGEGHFQIGLSQAYIPWILASLIATLYLPRRWPLGLLTVAVFLIVSAGSNWYVLTTLVTCAFIAAFGLWDWKDRRPRLNREALWRLVTALVLVVLVSAIRTIPQVTAAAYLNHPPEELTDRFTLAQVIAVYFEPTTGPAAGYWLRYNYIFPGVILAVLVVATLILVPRPRRIDFATLTVIVPAALAIALWSAFAMGGTDFVRSLYNAFPVLYAWRRLGRFGGAALPLIAVLVGLLFDSIIWRARAWARGDGEHGNEQHGNREQIQIGLPLIGPGVPLPRLMARGLSLALIVTGAYAGIDITQNWERVARLTPTDPNDGQLNGVTVIRQQKPGQFLQIDTYDMAQSIEFFSAMARMTVGNPEIYVFGRQSTFAEYRMYGRPADYAAGSNTTFLQSRSGYLYDPLPDAPKFSGTPVAWVYHDPLPYAFTVGAASGTIRAPFFGSETTPQTYFHQIDRILVDVGTHAAGDVLVVQENAYPGWSATVDGQDRPVESVGGVIGVRLSGTAPAHVVFTYAPARLWFAAALSLFGFILLTSYVLRLDDRIRHWRRLAQP
jgi:nicotinamide riboside transporter PnuC